MINRGNPTPLYLAACQGEKDCVEVFDLYDPTLKSRIFSEAEYNPLLFEDPVRILRAC